MIVPPARLLPPMVYLDNSALGRLSDPAPNVTITIDALRRIIADAVDVERIIDGIRAGRLALLSSEALVFEVRRAPQRVQLVSWAVLRMASAVVPVGPTLPLARLLQTNGFAELDALHIAAAYVDEARYAVTCDEAHWLRHVRQIATLLGTGPRISSPAECVAQEGLGS